MVESLMLQALAPIFEGRVYPDAAAGDTPMPFATFQQVGGASTVFMDGVLPDKQNARMQITVWAKGRAQASELIAKVQTALCGSPYFGLPQGAPVSLRDQETGFKGAMQDFSIWYAT
ncbi:DUF3168 domain-containing protein [Bordetella avium]|uniref:Phage protein n=1 Tax=Bordetella avium (strain 197N) TaxID=360910 RepID=Q2L2A4_BORA1|nr:DUF3168 domain-containing protein [Bordetella avium]AZY52235.1 DUF3168 domain-containing protein [Bordetella avium]RIQ47786.1 DUF3168 domain-containing protein [Bordetella avium]RIQ71044.1 DUF3168 domain-containing protein [Bordetella avium]CAJ49080.1 phage protein [Bordetella avium 197N]